MTPYNISFFSNTYLDGEIQISKSYISHSVNWDTSEREIRMLKCSTFYSVNAEKKQLLLENILQAISFRFEGWRLRKQTKKCGIIYIPSGSYYRIRSYIIIFRISEIQSPFSLYIFFEPPFEEMKFCKLH